MRQVGTRKTVRSPGDGIAGEVSLRIRWHQNRGFRVAPGGVWRVPADWPGGVRHVGDVSLICCSRTERGKARPDTAVSGGGDGDRESAKRAEPVRQ